MARLYESGFELQSVTAGMEWAAVTGSPSINTTTKRSGSASLRCNTSATTAYVQHDYADETTIHYLRAYIYIASMPAGLTTILANGDNADSYTSRIRLNSNGTLELWSDTAQIGSDSSALSTDTWYRIEWSYDDANANNTATAYIDGVQFATGNSGDNAGNGRLRVGVQDSATMDIYYDDIAVNNSAAGGTETGLPGAGNLVLALPTGAGSSNPTTGVYSYINEIPPTDTATSGSTMIELDTNPTNGDFNMTDSSTLGMQSDATVKYVSVWARIREEAAGTSNYTLRIRSRSAGTVSSSSSQDAGNATARTNPNGTTAFGVRHVAYVIPQDGTSAWTPTGTDSIDNMQIGVGTTDGNPDVWCLWLGAYVEYVDPTFSQTEAGFYEDGTETGSTAIDSGADSITRDVSSGDSNLQLRVRLQSTGGAGVSTDDYQLQYELNDSGGYNNVGSGINTYYFDGSDAAASDPGSVWTDDNNAFDSDTSDPPTTFATTTTAGSTSSNYLMAEGTNAPSWVATISQVRARIYGRANLANTLSATIYTDSLGESLGTPTVGGSNTNAWGGYTTLSAPSGGWTWAKVQALEVKVYTSGVRGDIYAIQLEVTSDAPIIGYNSASLTDGNATTNRLGSGTGSFVAGAISEDGLVDDFTHTASNYTEHLYSLTIESTAVADADTLDFRVLRNGATTGMTYTVTPRITIEKGAGDSTISKSESVTVSESTTLFIPEYNINKSDTATITESVQRQIENYIVKTDSTTLTENVNLATTADINVSDTTTLTESIQRESENYINKSDSTTVTDTPTVLIPELLVSKSDSTSLTESTKQEVESFINKSDSVSVTENVQREVENRISVSDTTTLTENIQRETENFINKSENITVTDTPTVSIESFAELSVNVSDNITVSENLVREVENYVNKSDSTTVTENLQREVENRISVSDTTSLTENVQLSSEGSINKSESATVTELIQRQVESFIDKSDSTTLTENRQLEVNSFINKSDSTSLNESIKLEGESYINKSESVSVSENLLREVVGRIAVSETVSTTEAVTVLIPEYLINVSDNTSVSESIDPETVNFINKSDGVTVSESVSVEPPLLEINKSESVSVSESIQRLVENRISVSDTTTLTESVQAFIPEYKIIVSDESTVSESVIVNIVSAGDRSIIVNESVTVTESVALELEGGTNPSNLLLLGVG